MKPTSLTSMLMALAVGQATAQTVFFDDFQTGSATATTGTLSGTWSSSGPETKEYNLANSGVLDLRDHNAAEKGANTANAGYWETVKADFPATTLATEGDWIELTLDLAVYQDDSGAPMPNTSGVRISLVDSTRSIDAGYGFSLGTGTVSSQSLKTFNSGTGLGSTLGTLDFDPPEDGTFLPIKLRITRQGANHHITASHGTVSFDPVDTPLGLNAAFDRFTISPSDKDHGLKIDRVHIERSPPKSAIWEQYVAAHNSGGASTLPDYSYAGYHHSEIPLPDVTASSHTWFNVTSFGAVPDDDISDRDAALAAFAAAHNHSGPAVIHFPPGRYLLNETSDLGKAPLEVKRSNIVIKGAGVASTELVFNDFSKFGHPQINFRSSSGVVEDYWRGDQLVSGQVTQQLDKFSVTVSNASGLAAGQRINFSANFDALGTLAEQYFAPHAVPQGVKDRHSGLINDIFEVHTIRSVSGTTVTFDEPIQLDIPYFQSIKIYKLNHTIQESGIEDLSLTGGYRGQFNHHNGARQGEYHDILQFDHSFNCWAKNLRISNYSFALQVLSSGANTFSDIVLEGNAGHNSITVQRATGNLFSYIRENTDTHHGLGVRSSAACTVFLRCTQFGNLEGHCGFPRAMLYDCNEGEFARMRPGGSTFFPHQDKGLTFWNWNNTFAGTYDFWPEGNNYGYLMPPVIAGLHGEPVTIPDAATDVLALESMGTAVQPDSLFESQLALRLGSLPAWLESRSADFEAISRHSKISINSPSNHQSFSTLSPVSVTAEVPAGMEPQHISQVDFLLSSSSRWDGYTIIPKADPKALSVSFTPPREGVWILKARMLNSRGEITNSEPVTIHCGNPSDVVAATVATSTMIKGTDKSSLYNTFTALGGGEAASLTGSAVLAAKPANQPYHEIAVAFEAECQSIYQDFATNTLSAYLAEPARLAAAGVFFDGNSNTSGSLYHSLDTLVQATFATPTRINRMEIRWKGTPPTSGTRIEIQTPLSYPACLTSMVNDEPLWESSLGKIGGTLRKEVLPASNGVTTLYFPERTVQAVRVLFSSLSGTVAEISFLGPQANPAMDSYLTWTSSQKLTGLDTALLADPDADSRKNLIEYAFGTDPKLGTDDASKRPDILSAAPEAQSQASFTYLRRRNAPALGLTYQIETSDSMNPNSWNTQGIIETGSIVIDDDFERVTASLTFADASKGFVRLRISMSP